MQMLLCWYIHIHTLTSLLLINNIFIYQTHLNHQTLSTMEITSLNFKKNKTFHHVFRSNCVLLFVIMVSCSPPEGEYHIKCSSSNNSNCTITNSYGVFPDRSICKVANVGYPTTEEELISIVSTATKAKRKMKVATSTCHSVPKLVCPDGQDGLLISTKNLNRVLKLDAQAMTITVESGVTLRQLISEAAKAGLVLPYTPYWWGLTVGGMLGTAAHGSTLWGNASAIQDFVVELRIVSPAGVEDGYAKLRVLNEKHHDLLAAKVSLGVLGVVSQVTFQLQPMFKRSITYQMKDDYDIADQALILGKQHEFGDIYWFPSQHKAVYRIDDRVSSNEFGDGVYDHFGQTAVSTLQVEAMRAVEENEESRSDVDGKCERAKINVATLINSGFGLKNNGINFTRYPVIGFHNRLQSSGSCLDHPDDGMTTTCFWDPRINNLFFHQTTFTIGLSVVKNFIEDVQKLVALDSKAFCAIDVYQGIFVRYLTASSAYLGKEEDSMEFDFLYYRSKDRMTPRLYEDILEEIEQMGVFKYGGLPHWGKNRNIVFKGVMKKYKNAGEFLRVKEVYDPLGLFSSEWTDNVLGLKDEVSIVKHGCALEGLCICSEDIHCAPQKGLFCRPGKIYTEARVCTRVSSSIHIEL